MRVFYWGVWHGDGQCGRALKKMGHQVAGSDAGVYPPMSDVLESAGIELFEGFAEQDMLIWQPDRVVSIAVSVEIHRSNIFSVPEIDFVSLPQLIGEDLIGNRPTVQLPVPMAKPPLPLSPHQPFPGRAGPRLSHRRRTTDLPSGNELGGSASPFVIEGDEYDPFFDKRSKFIHYRPGLG